MTPNVIFALVTCAVLSACASGGKNYPNVHEKNLVINLKLGDESKRSGKIDFLAGVNDIAKDCTNQYQGDIALSSGLNQIGLAPGKLTYIIVLAIHSGGFLGRDNGFSAQQGALFKPMPGRKYEIVINYVDDMWDFKLNEVNGSRRQELAVVPISACKPA